MQTATDLEANARPENHDSRRPAETEALAMHGVSKAFGAVQAVQEVDLRIAVGETIAILGPNGAGKTTTISMMLGLLNPDAQLVATMRASRCGGFLQGVIAK